MSQKKEHYGGAGFMMGIIVLFGILFYGGLTWIASADSHAAGIKGLKFFGDGRVRMETASQTTATDEEQDRERFRYRLRLGLTYKASDIVEFGARLASNGDVNSPHINFGGGFDRDSIAIDKTYVKASYMGGFAWFGKNEVPFWEQNEYYWDADINPEGLAVGYTVKDLGPVSLTLQGGYFNHTEKSWETGTPEDDTTVTMYQAVVKGGIDPVDAILAYGAASFDDGNSTTSCDAAAADCTYTLTSVQVKVKSIPGIGLTLGYDMLSSDASANDSGSVISAQIDYNKFKFVLRLPDIEGNAGPGRAGLSQDDWPSYKADFKGTGVNIGYKIAGNMDVDFKWFDGEDKDSGVAVNTIKEQSLTQVNFNVKF